MTISGHRSLFRALQCISNGVTRGTGRYSVSSNVSKRYLDIKNTARALSSTLRVHPGHTSRNARRSNLTTAGAILMTLNFVTTLLLMECQKCTLTHGYRCLVILKLLNRENTAPILQFENFEKNYKLNREIRFAIF